LVDERGYVSLEIPAPTPRHRSIWVEISAAEINYSIGKLWGEGIQPSEEVLRHILATLDAARDRGFREVRDRRTGILYHLFQLRSRGLNEYGRDSDYSLWHWLRLRVRRVKVTTVPALLSYHSGAG